MSVLSEITADVGNTFVNTDGMAVNVTVDPDVGDDFAVDAVMVFAMGEWTPESSGLPLHSRKFQDTAQMLVTQADWARPTLLDHVLWQSPGASAAETWRVTRIGGAFAGLWLLDLTREGYY